MKTLSPRFDRALCVFGSLAALAGLPLAASAQAAAQALAKESPQELKPVTVVRGLANAWALAFLPDGRMLVTEKPGRLRIIAKDGSLGEPLAGLPAVDNTGQCGLLDVVVDPQFTQNRLIYWTFTEPAGAGQSGNSTAVARARLGPDDKLSEVRTVFVQQPKVASRLHCGSRIAFARDGSLWVGLGDRFERKEDAQVGANHLGKIVRIDRDGKAPADNPFVVANANTRTGIALENYSLGHRNIQGMAVHPATGELWESEHGPQGGDEINRIEPGRNYGWPLVTYGRNYGTGTRIGEDGPKLGFEQPLRWWVPSVAPSGLAFITSERYPGWKGNLVMGALRGQVLIRLTLDGNQVVGEERLLQSLGARIRDVRQGPDGYLYIVTDGSDGRVMRLERWRRLTANMYGNDRG
jgi:aldose sugar dehydrogenase